MNMFSTALMSDRAVITCIQIVNKNNKISKNQSKQTYGLLQGVINGTVKKQPQNKSNRQSKVCRGEKHNDQLKIVT